ncbi:MAG: nucleotidyltransferase domain-containing protein [Geobacter sp.]|nr:nucleotidyltransferase domain-containing protein [Geobacter sp.]
MARLEPSTLRLSPRHLEILLGLLLRYVPDAEVLAYGSRVNGDCHDASDLDLVVRNPVALNESQPGLPDLKEALVESNLPIRVEVVDWARIPEAFRREIERAYVVVQGGLK